jgi:hypothetical protein
MLARLARPVLAISALAGICWLLVPHGFPQYDTEYALVWGDQLAHGTDPDYGAPIPPTPHPLADLWGVLVSPLGTGAETATVILAYLALGAVGYLVFRLGAVWFDPWVGAVAAAIVLTREPLLSDGVRAYVDIPYLALVLGALLIESRRRRAGTPVLALLALAGLLRPEAWLFSAAYLAYLALEREPDRGRLALRWRRERARDELLGLAALAASAPLIWAAFDWITTGDPLYSFTGTRDTVETLGRETGAVDLVVYGPRRLGEVLREPGLLGAAGGLLLGLAFLRRRSLLGAAAAVLAAAAFAVLAIAGLAIIPRYLLLTAAVLSVFCALGLLGWRLLSDGHPWRGRWRAFAALTAVLFVVFAPSQIDRVSDLRDSIATQDRIGDDLTALADEGAFAAGCDPISVPNHRLVPILALALERTPSAIISSSEQRQPRRGYFVAPASKEVEDDFVLDPNDPRRLITGVPPGFELAERNASWEIYERC